MNSDQVASLVRTILKFGAGTAVGVAAAAWLHLDGTMVEGVIGAVAVVVAGIWSHVAHSDA